MEIITYPKSFSNLITVEINTDSEDHYIIILSNHLGRNLRMMGVNLSQGKACVHMNNLETLEAGTYKISVKNTQSNILHSSILTKF